MTGSLIKMITGLGNPGKQYSWTRHNLGFLVLDQIAKLHSLSFTRSKFDAEYLKAPVFGHQLFLVKPQSYMNLSGGPIQRLAAYYQVPLETIVVVHDDLDLDFGTVKIVQNRGHGGHNGVRSIISAFGSRNFIRLRLGVGRPAGSNMTSHVLGGFSPEEEDLLEKTVENGAAACRAIVQEGVTPAMNTWNRAS